MEKLIYTGVLTLLFGVLSMSTASAQAVSSATPSSVAAKLMIRGDVSDVDVTEMRLIRRNDILTVQADLRNSGRKDQTVYYRYRWLDQSGNQFGDGEAWKQLNLMGQVVQSLKGVAPHSLVNDFRLELSFQKKRD